MIIKNKCYEEWRAPNALESKNFQKNSERSFHLEPNHFLIAITKHLVNRLPFHGSWKYHLATWSLFGKWETKGNQNTGQVGDEWRICQLETIPEDWYMESERPTEANSSRPLVLLDKNLWPEADARPWKEIPSVKWRSCRQLLFSGMAM